MIKAELYPLPPSPFFFKPYLVVSSANFYYSPTQRIQRCPAKRLYFFGSTRSNAAMFHCDVIARLPTVLGSASKPPDDAGTGTSPPPFLNESLFLLGFVTYIQGGRVGSVCVIHLRQITCIGQALYQKKR